MKQKLKKLPLGITTFSDIRDKAQNYLYVDKTAIAYDLIENAKYYFLCRPRRFGKSLFLDTLSEIFLGNKELFEGLHIYDKYNWEQKYPVIRIDFNTGDYKTDKGIKERMFDILLDNADRLDIVCKKPQNITSCFNEIIKKAYQKHNQKVVILIDEYDKPILDNINDIETAQIARDLLRVFYTVIKGADRYLKFVFMTGVSKFSKLNLFSGLNNIQDITTMQKYANICGYTHNDIKTIFAGHLKEKNVDLEKLKLWYNGYNYFGDPLYNPYDILLFISNGCEYQNYWWETGGPKFLIDMLKKNDYNIPQLQNIVVSKETLNTFDIEKIDLIALLWQTGYLTFDKKIQKLNKIFYQMKIPNKEVQGSLNELFVKYFTDSTHKITDNQIKIYDTLQENIEDLEQVLKSLFASIPYNNYTKNVMANYEGYYSSVIFAYFASLGFEIIAEDATNTGRIDLTIKLPNRIIILEFKVDIKETALQQIKEKKYYKKYQNENKDIYIIGVCFDSKQKNITEFEWEKV
ncbi:MAG: hypothetical protein DRQ51_01335 [Gammaproteobacteria bacterium]|nr:MAG: hypothetical protein DRQ51_01335 [Gammaproteobacteria bacterium]